MTGPKALAAVIRGIRHSRGLKQEDIDTVTRSYMGQLERGEVNVSIEVLQRIAHILNVDTSVLLLITSALMAGHSVRVASQIFAEQLEELEHNGAIARITEIAASGQPTQFRESLAAERLEKVRSMRQIGMSMSEIAKALDMSKSTVHKYLHRSDD